MGRLTHAAEKTHASATTRAPSGGRREPVTTATGLPRFLDQPSADADVQLKCAACASGTTCPACADEPAIQTEAAGPAPAPAPGVVRAVGRHGVEAAASPLPHFARIQAAFGRHDVSGVHAQVGGPAADASTRMGALAYTAGDRVGFRSEPDLRLAAHEAAHVVQQRSGVKLAHGVGHAGDAYERSADGVAEAVAQGRSAEPLLDEHAGSGSGDGGVQMKCAGCGGAIGGAPSCPSCDDDEPVQMKLDVDATRDVAPPVATGGAPAANGDIGAAAREPARPVDAATPKSGPTAPSGAPAPDPIAAACPRPAPPEGAAAEPKAKAGTRVAPKPGLSGLICAFHAPKPLPIEKPPEGADDDPPEPAPGSVKGDLAPEGPTAEDAPNFGQNPVAKDVAKTSKGDAGAKLSDAAGNTAKGATPTRAPVPAGGGLGEVAGPAPSPLESAIGVAEGAREHAVAVSEESSTILDDVGDRTGRVGGPLRFGGAGRDGADGPRIARSSARASSFFSESSGALRRLVGAAGVDLQARLGTAASAVKDTLAADTLTHQAVVSERFAQARATARGQAHARLADIDARHDATAFHITLSTIGAELMLALGRASALARIDELEGPQKADVAKKYLAGMKLIRATGPKVGDAAIEIGKLYMALYDSTHKRGPLGHDRVDLDADELSFSAISPPSAEKLAAHQRANAGHEKDGFFAGYLTDRRAHARMKAARDVAKGYRDSFIKEADKQAFEAWRGMGADICTVGVVAGIARKQVEDQYAALREALAKGKRAALDGASETRRQLSSAVHEQLRAVLGVLDGQEVAQRQALADTGYVQKLMVEQVAHLAASGAADAIADAVDGVNTTLAAVRESFGASGAPDPDAFSQGLTPVEGRLLGGLARASDAVDRAGANAERSLADVGEAGRASLAEVGTSAGDLVDGITEGFGGAMRVLSAGTRETFTKLTTGYTGQVALLSSSATNGFKDVGDGLKKSFEGMSTGLEKGFQKQAEALESGLGESLATMCDQKEGIPKYAAEAAAREQPAWKKVVAILLIIIVIVVVALVLGPFVIGGIGALAGGGVTGAIVGGVVGGAIIGAATSATITMINNWSTGQDLLKGVGRAALIGAISGAIGGGIGAGLNAAVTGGTQIALTLGQRALMFGVNVASDVVIEIGTSLATGEFSWDAIGMAALTSLLTGGFGEIKGVGKIQQRFSASGAKVGTGVRARVAPGVPAPTPAPRAEGGAPERRPVAEAAPPTGARPAEAGPPARVGAPEGGTPGARPETPGTPRRTTHQELPEIEPGVVARHTTADGHEAKVLKDGRTVVCSAECGEILNRFKAELDADPELRARVEKRTGEIDAMADADAKAVATSRLRTELEGVRARKAAAVPSDELAGRIKKAETESAEAELVAREFEADAARAETRARAAEKDLETLTLQAKEARVKAEELNAKARELQSQAADGAEAATAPQAAKNAKAQADALRADVAQAKARATDARAEATAARKHADEARQLQGQTKDIELQLQRQRLDEELQVLRTKREDFDRRIRRREADVAAAKKAHVDAQLAVRNVQEDIRWGRRGPNDPQQKIAADAEATAKGKVAEAEEKLRTATDLRRRNVETARAKEDAFREAERIAKGITPAHYDYLRGRTPRGAEIDAIVAARNVDDIYGRPMEVKSADHLVSMHEITTMDGFSRLTPDQQVKILNTAENIIVVEKNVNSSKGDRNLSEWEGHPDIEKYGKMDPQRRADLLVQEQKMREKLQRMINDLLPKL